MLDNIIVKGARENNLKGVNIVIPRNKLVVFTGLSGSGKTSLAFGTIFAEGQRRFMESLSSYARQFLGQIQKPNVDSIDGLSPSIAIDQKTTNHNPRSTVGTVTEIYDYLRLLWAKIGKAHCPECGLPIAKQGVDQIIAQLNDCAYGQMITIEAPVIRGLKGTFVKHFEQFKKSGYTKIKIDGQIYRLNEQFELDKNIRHNISVVTDRIEMVNSERSRVAEAIENALKLGNGLVNVVYVDDGVEVEKLFSDKYACTECGISIEEIEPRLFSFNSPFGACSDCSGLGYKMEIDPELLIPNKDLSIAEGGIHAGGWNYSSWQNGNMMLNAFAKKYKISVRTPIKDIPQDVYNVLLYGSTEKFRYEYESEKFRGEYEGKFEGVIPNLMRRYKETTSDFITVEINKLMKKTPCATCEGQKLKKEARAVKVGGINVTELTNKPVKEILAFFKNLQLRLSEQQISEQILKEIYSRCQFLVDVGLHYLTLSRGADTLSGGEAQRIRLATQIGSGLMGVLYILDEPSIGLHQRDNARLLGTLTKLRDLGNTVIVVEHDDETIRAADCIVDIGPAAGKNGGELVAIGSVEDIINCPRSITGQFLSGKERVEVPVKYRNVGNNWLEIVGASQNNLKNITVKFPLNVITAVTGVSGSGKSSLVNKILYPALCNRINRSRYEEGEYKQIKGYEHIDKIIQIDQGPIGRTPRSNPATYTGVWTAIRELFTRTLSAKEKGYGPGRFSFNTKGGRCEACCGDGVTKIEMHFLPDVYVNCEVCNGKRFNAETLDVQYKGKNIYEILEMTVEEACDFFENIPAVYTKVKALNDVGLGYIKLGQSATTFSGGEAQRVKLATELCKRSTGKTLYILDEPTTGLHVYDVKKLIGILQKLANNGNTVIIIEHNLDVIKTCDYIIDLGPEGGSEGGFVVATGNPKDVAKNQKSLTGKFLADVLA
ncbi:MAG: excinuclease ABC subunit UvrA [Firmicutes bacterium]|nr:excinuclease ABC subunit UvrA [Bacillota bacterium]